MASKEKEGNGGFLCISVLENSKPSWLEAAKLQGKARKPFFWGGVQRSGVAMSILVFHYERCASQREVVKCVPNQSPLLKKLPMPLEAWVQALYLSCLCNSAWSCDVGGTGCQKKP